MKSILLRFVKTYLLFVLIFITQKPLFMLFYHDIFTPVKGKDYLDVIWNGLPLDLSIAGYLSVIPGLILIGSLWLVPSFTSFLRKIYFGVAAGLLSVIFVCDLVLYHYWGFRLDSTPLFYFFTSPKDALASVGTGTVFIGFGAAILCTGLFYAIFNFTLIRQKERHIKNRLKSTTVMLLAIGLLFIPIRGGFTVSVMNVGKVYFSDNSRLNHAAINPGFSLMESLTRERNFDKQYRFMTSEEADETFKLLTDKPVTTDSIPELFTCKRPNIVFVVLESFLSQAMEILGGTPEVAVHMDQLSREGVLFTNFYANSFRTDRGLVSIFSGYPAQPTTSIMKYPRKTQSLPSIPRSLKNAGYKLQYYYGGDADFTNMRSYLVSTGINQITSDKDFPVKERLSKWGAHDHVVFNRFLSELKDSPPAEPFMTIIQTSSSHEPFEVPFQKLGEPFLNSVAYTDSCLGDFIDRYKQTPLWDNSVIILVPDHAGRYPQTIDNLSPERYQIPLLLIGGAVKTPMNIHTYGSQIDIAATILSQLSLPHDEFTFSKNLLNPNTSHFAYFTYPNAFGMITPDNQLVFDCQTEQIHINKGDNPGANTTKGKAFLQKLYDDLAVR